MCAYYTFTIQGADVAQNAHPDAPGLVRAGIEVRSLRELGAAVRSARRSRSMTQSDLAGWLGTSRYTVHRLEAGRPVSLALALRAIAVLGYTITLTPRGPGPEAEGGAGAT